MTDRLTYDSLDQRLNSTVSKLDALSERAQCAKATSSRKRPSAVVVPDASGPQAQPLAKVQDTVEGTKVAPGTTTTTANTCQVTAMRVDKALPFKVGRIDGRMADYLCRQLDSTHTTFSWCCLTTRIGSTDAAYFSPEMEEDSYFAPEIFRVCGVALCTSENVVSWFDVGEPEVKQALSGLMRSRSCVKALHSMKGQLKAMAHSGLPVSLPIWDPKIAVAVESMGEPSASTMSQLLVAAQQGAQARRHVMPVPESVETKLNPVELCCLRAYYSFGLALITKAAASASGHTLLLEEMEMPLIRVLADMEDHGFGFAKEECVRRKDLIQTELRETEREAQSLVGHPFSLTSKTEVAQLLYDELRLPLPSLPATWGHKPGKPTKRTTKDEVLEVLEPQHGVVKLIRRHRKLSHTLTNYMESYPLFARWSEELKMDRIHCEFCQTSSDTGRITTDNPNLQCTPNDCSVTVHDICGEVTLSPRAAFVPLTGCELLSADYSQVELRLLAHFSRDPSLIGVLEGKEEAFNAIAKVLFGKDDSSFTDRDRKRAKGLCYGILYGKSAASLCRDLGCTREQAETCRRDFLARFPEVCSFIERTVEQCSKDGFVTTLLGRRRSISKIFGQGGDRRQGERQAVNSVCQGSAADIIKRAMIITDNEIRSRSLGSRLVLELHDELIYEVPKTELHFMRSLLVRVMEHDAPNGKLSVRLPVHLRQGLSWGALRPVVQ